jgi:hypothetical protein
MSLKVRHYFGPAGGVWPKSAFVGGPLTQCVSQAPSTVINTTDPSEVHAWCCIFEYSRLLHHLTPHERRYYSVCGDCVESSPCSIFYGFLSGMVALILGSCISHRLLVVGDDRPYLKWLGWLSTCHFLIPFSLLCTPYGFGIFVETVLYFTSPCEDFAESHVDNTVTLGHYRSRSAQQRRGQLVHGGSHGIFDRLHEVDLRGIRFGVTQHRLHSHRVANALHMRGNRPAQHLKIHQRCSAGRTARRFLWQESNGEYTPKVGPMQKAGTRYFMVCSRACTGGHFRPQCRCRTNAKRMTSGLPRARPARPAAIFTGPSGRSAVLWSGYRRGSAPSGLAGQDAPDRRTGYAHRGQNV